MSLVVSRKSGHRQNSITRGSEVHRTEPSGALTDGKRPRAAHVY